MSSVLIKNGQVVSSKEIQKADVLIESGIIKRVETEIHISADRVIDASGLYVIPGVLDPQVHFRDPGATHKEDLHTGSVAAAAGGVTGFFDMPNNNPSIVTRELMAMKKKIASEKCVVNYNFFFGATPHNLEEINKVENVCGIKIFMGSSTGNLLVEKEEDLDRIFGNGERLIAVHAEDNGIIDRNAKLLENSTNFDDHRRVRSEQAALKATKLAVGLALKHKRRLHVLHLTTQEEAEFLAQYKDEPLISTEVCPQHLFLHAPDVYDTWGSLAQMNPPIREKRHAEALWEALKSGVINCIATDHAPHTREEKNRPFGKAPSGMPGVETSLPLMLHQVSLGKCTLQEVVAWMCENPVSLYKVVNKGYIKPNYDADITIVNLEKVKKITDDSLFTKVKWSCFSGKELKGWPEYTLVGGHVVFEKGQVDTSFRGSEIQIAPL